MKKRVHEMELNRSSVQMVLAERFPGYSRASDFNSVISDPQDIMVRGNEESFMEHGFGVAGLVDDAVIGAGGGNIAHGDVQLAAALEQSGDHGAVIAHRTGDRDLVALAALVKLDGHIFHLEAAAGVC